MAKSNRANARMWRDDQKQQKCLDEDLENEMEKLRYAGCKRDNMPDPDTFVRAGMSGVAQKIRQALSILDDAYLEASNGR